MLEFSLKRVSEIQVKEMPTAPVKNLVKDTKSLSMFWAESSDHKEQTSPSSSSDLDAIFFQSKKNAQAAQMSQQDAAEPDLGQILLQQVKVNAIADNGAVLNGRFFPVGSAVQALQMSKKNGMIVVPVLIAVSSKQVSLSVEEKIVKLPFQGKF